LFEHLTNKEINIILVMPIIASDILKQETLKSPDDVEMMDVNSLKPAGQLLRRNRPGTTAKNWCNWPDEELDEMDSTLATQQVCLLSNRLDMECAYSKSKLF
jgi:hypothetical protein